MAGGKGWDGLQTDLHQLLFGCCVVGSHNL